MMKAEKEKMFRYGSGDAPIKVGQTVIYYHTNQRGRLAELVVTKIGRDLVHFGRENPFYFNGEERTQYTRGTLFPSHEIYERYVKERDFIRKVDDMLQRRSLTFEQAKHLNKFLDYKIEEV